MNKTIFITGSSGFIAGSLLKRINPDDYEKIYCLSRTESEITRELSRLENFKFIKGSIFDSGLYSRYLASSDIVVHLAAITGKAAPEEYFKVNSEGTEFLLEQCENLGVKNFLYVSSIAVKFSDAPRYYYGLSKMRGEELVRGSSLDYTIVRPAIVIGRGSPILESFEKLARVPVTPIFGNGRTRIQPIHVDDLVDCLMTIINEETFANETFELGGPEAVTIEDFIKTIHRIHYKKDPRIIHVPLGLIIPPLSIIERFLLSMVPFTVGQLSSFRYDGTIEENRLFLKHLPDMKDVNKMIETSLEQSDDLRPSDELEEECARFCRYLIDQEANGYVLRKYREAHTVTDITGNIDLFDKFLIRTAAKSPVFTKLVDAYTRVFFKNSVIRKKLILVLAILESSEPAYRFIDSADQSARAVLYLRMFQKGFVFSVTLFISMAMLTPLHLISIITSKFSVN